MNLGKLFTAIDILLMREDDTNSMRFKAGMGAGKTAPYLFKLL
jgi:hypothetical protein